jgi:hypothetical protein
MDIDPKPQKGSLLSFDLEKNAERCVNVVVHGYMTGLISG